MNKEQLQSFIEEMERRIIIYDNITENALAKGYWKGKANEARFVIDRIKHLMNSN